MGGCQTVYRYTLSEKKLDKIVSDPQIVKPQ